MFHSESLFPDPMLFGSATSRFTIDITSLELLYPNQTLLVFSPPPLQHCWLRHGWIYSADARTLAAWSATFRGVCPSLILLCLHSGSIPAGFHHPGDPRYRPGSGADTCDTYATFTTNPTL